ncbi:hypothetical protein MPTK1_6g07080 [Marchantia polymorpha subsp. ruderalis]|uniref:Uncharacterized protein n=2 Tax=Marchantia polymorpha TaxID=3197 RepID=A0AAF6BPE0_MARPO|nr:hypothetical protein MARPO_0053s0022 [Marchantia polymorpha]BBN13874.1 hypothetical protein Mp_6g07080 [Marchantia polymorpha subsp. ruderalis]|eukprot:PTQ38075.1 hypothetical protein MARPO_0053s0022 [Marchantia polymorpha]
MLTVVDEGDTAVLRQLVGGNRVFGKLKRAYVRYDFGCQGWVLIEGKEYFGIKEASGALAWRFRRMDFELVDKNPC